MNENNSELGSCQALFDHMMGELDVIEAIRAAGETEEDDDVGLLRVGPIVDRMSDRDLRHYIAVRSTTKEMWAVVDAAVAEAAVKRGIALEPDEQPQEP